MNTRATLFDVVEGSYRFVAAGSAASTAAAPYKNIGEGVRRAIETLQTITGRKLLNEENRLIVPVNNGAGVDSFAATFSAGPALRTVVVGLQENVSIESAMRLARTTYTRVDEVIGLNDKRKPEQQIDSLLHLQPDLILFTGGMDNGSARSIERMMEIIGLACYVLPTEKRPAVLYAGNAALAEKVKASLQPLTSAFEVGPNLRPSLGVEDLQPAQQSLNRLYAQVRERQMGGVSELDAWAGNTLMPTACAEGRIIRFLSKVYDSTKGILGVDLGASAVSVAAAVSGNLSLSVYPQLGLGESLADLLRYTNLEDILRWLSPDISAETVQSYLYQKSIYPASLPATSEELSIEHALARQTLAVAMASAAKDFPPRMHCAAPGLTPCFEPILAGGSVLTRAPSLGQSLLILLDAIQPVGITTLILDRNNLLPALGAAAGHNAILPVQVLESGAFLGLATVVAPYADVAPGTPVLRGRLVYQNGNESQLDVKAGALEVLALPVGQSGRLYLQPQHRADIGFGPGRGQENGIPVTGTALGVVIDARGRPLTLPADPEERRELLKRWRGTVGG